MADEHGPACWIEIGFDKRKRLADSQTGSPEHDDESAQSIARVPPIWHHPSPVSAHHPSVPDCRNRTEAAVAFRSTS
jgi:hypothetical protein